jgi:HPt (histidine-containing phosphotransfer) domain-containing protein
MQSAPGSIDTSNVVSVCRIGGVLDQALLGEMLGYFVTENERRIAGLSPALSGRNREALRDLAHAVRGSAAMVGAGRLHQLAGLMEREAGTADFGELGESFDAIKLEFEAVVTALRTAHPEAWFQDE